MKGKWIDITAHEGQTFKAYAAEPRKGSGPGIVLCQEIFGVNQHMRDIADLFAEEGYTVIVPDLFWRIEPNVELTHERADYKRAIAISERFNVSQALLDIEAAIRTLQAYPTCKGRTGALGYCLGGKLALMTAAAGGVDCAVSYYGVGIDKILDETRKISVPVVLHFAGEDEFMPPEAVRKIRQQFSGHQGVEIHIYPDVHHAFSSPASPSYHKPSSDMAYSRTIALFRKIMGPHYDLSALWETHRCCEFETRDADATMETMVDEPYVNHVPTMTGGYGYRSLHRFYKYHFIPQLPKDTKNIPVSRTVGVDRIVNEGVLCFTHDIEIDWMLPGVEPTGRYVEIPIVGIVTFRGDKLVHEHIYWDQASVLAQIGLLDAKSLPIAGIETAKKVLDPTMPANTLMANWSKSAATPRRGG